MKTPARPKMPENEKIKLAYETMEYNNLIVSRIENVIIDSVVKAPASVTDFVSHILSSHYPFQIAKEEKVDEFWTMARNRNQEIVDWLLFTYYNCSRAVGGVAAIDVAISVYAQSVGFDMDGVIDEDMGSRLASPEEIEKLLRLNRWYIVILGLFSIDLESLEIENAKG